MKANLVSVKEYELEKEVLTQIYGGKSGHFVYKEGRLVWVEK
jgi:hypothetical protein